LFFLYLEKKVPVRRTGAYRHKKSPVCDTAYKPNANT